MEKIMKNYELGADEVVLYKGSVTPVGIKGETQLILTNLNIVFITEIKKFLAKDEINVEVYPIEDIKIYKNVPQVKVVNDDIVEIYLTTTEKEFKFSSVDEVEKFVQEVKELLIRKPLGTRCINKVKDVIGEEGMHIIGAVGTAVAAGAGAAIASKVMPKKGIIGKIFGKGRKSNEEDDKSLESAENSESVEDEMLENEGEE
jgi:hypothetical protein